MSFDYHKRWHAGEKPYECDICGRRTICFGDLKKHKRMHSDKRPYVCEVCGKSFRFISNLNRHRKGHTGKRLYVCHVCGRSFIYNEGLRDHIKAGRCPGLKTEAGTGGKASHRGPRPRNSNAVVSMSMMNLAVNGTLPITVAPQHPPQLQPEPPSGYITKTILNPVNLANNLAPTLQIQPVVPACSPSPSTIPSHQQHDTAQLVPSSSTFVQMSAPPHHPSVQQQHINQHNATVTCTLPEYMSDFTAWPQYMIRNTTAMSEDGDVGQPGTNVVIVPQFY
ncbi:zinc finger protein [Elysia marginata]|uniref:Zinc finger protein n=1 Tax=Elysia marginata TaxID=1093978 RepID=A0AAV4GJS7_9GAST|nr:zinc finger protein [Elysia marginata]